jgi:carbamate kinase
MLYDCEKTVLVALGGNAILKYKEEGTAQEQMRNVRTSCHVLARLIRDGYHIAITHGNGPQVGTSFCAMSWQRVCFRPCRWTSAGQRARE